MSPGRPFAETLASPSMETPFGLRLPEVLVMTPARFEKGIQFIQNQLSKK